MNLKNELVNVFLDELNHPFREEIDYLRNIILGAGVELHENIKWNGPNYTFNNEDRITMSIQSPNQIHIVFHCGAKVQVQPKNKLISFESGLLEWKTNDRAIVTFKNLQDIENKQETFKNIIVNWVNASK